MPLPDWLSWELWTTALYAVLDGPRRLAVWIWAGYVLNRADRERRITESFAKAVEQLGSERLETRLGAIYTLKRIAGESQREYWPIMETLTAFVREHAPRPPADATRMNSSPPIRTYNSPFLVEVQVLPESGKSFVKEPQEAQIRPRTDIQAVLTVLGRRDEMVRQQDQDKGRRLDLAGTDLRGAKLGGAHLEGISLPGAHLHGADFSGDHCFFGGLLLIFDSHRIRS